MNILVTGASKGIGKSIALKLKEFGHNVYGAARNEHALKSLTLAGYRVCDLSEFEELQNLGNYIKEKQIDVLVNNAGEYIYSPIDKTDYKKLSDIVEVNL
jgi:short-subunit dehydrogenase